MEVKLGVFYLLLLSALCSLLVTNAKKGTTTKPTPPSTSNTAQSSPKASNSTKASTNAPKLPCEERNTSCSFCTKDKACFYCGEDKTCRKYKKSKIIPRNCAGNKWYWRQCTIPGDVLIIVIPVVAGVLLIMFGICCYCCCRTRSSRSAAGREEARQSRNRLDREQRNEENRRNRSARQNAIKMKYGLLKNDNDDDLQPIV